MATVISDVKITLLICMPFSHRDTNLHKMIWCFSTCAAEVMSKPSVGKTVEGHSAWLAQSWHGECPGALGPGLLDSPAIHQDNSHLHGTVWFTSHQR